MGNLIESISKYRLLILLCLCVLLIIVAVIVLRALISAIGKYISDKQSVANKGVLREKDFSVSQGHEKNQVLRQFIVPEGGIDPAPNGYMIINDGGKDAFVRTMTISSMPKRIKFADTLAPLLNYPDVTASIRLLPVPVEKMRHKIERQIEIVEAEAIASEGETNRVRKLQSQFREWSTWAEELEEEEESFFDVGFIFTFVADSVSALNKKTDDFRSKAHLKGLEVSNCFGVQAEAFLENMPFNGHNSVISKYITSSAICYHPFNSKAASALFNYTSSSFSHKKGVPLGRNMGTFEPFFYDLFDPSHFGFTLLIFGKTNSGKSATIKMLAERMVLLGIRFVAIDTQQRKGTSEGEYATLAVVVGGVNYKISASSGEILNPFEVQESVVYIKENASSGYERRTLELAAAIPQKVAILRTMMQTSSSMKDKRVELDAVMEANLDDILTSIVKELYEERGIKDGDADSLYTFGTVVSGAKLQSGVIPKELPAVTDYYKKLLIKSRQNTNPDMERCYRLLQVAHKEYVRELYYAPESLVFFTREEYQALDYDADNSNIKLYYREDIDDYEEVVVIKGIRPYFDGQSTVAINHKCPFTNLDISLLSEEEKVVAQAIALDVMTEQFIKKNSEQLSSSDHIVGICDESHDFFKHSYARKSLENTVRTVRKRNAGMIFGSQTVREFEAYEETRAILSQAATKMVFKQDEKVSYLEDVLNITASQASRIVNELGSARNDDFSGRNKGEMCVIDGNDVAFCKVDYLRKTEYLSVETDAAAVMKKIGNAS